MTASHELPNPPYPESTKANGWKPRVDWQQIKISRAWLLCPPEQRNNLLRLLLESWNQYPTGAWEADDELIAASIDMPPTLFVSHRHQLMRGWYMASDERLYHPVVTEMVLVMLAERANGRERATAAKLRDPVISRDGEVCAYCGTREGPFHIDHIHPLSRGGSNDLTNLCVACIPCNLSKGARTPDEWLGALRGAPRDGN